MYNIVILMMACWSQPWNNLLCMQSVRQVWCLCRPWCMYLSNNRMFLYVQNTVIIGHHDCVM